MTKQEIIAHAAEAILIKQDDKLIKRRISKGYRIPELDEKLRKLRTRSEARILEKAESLISVPKVLKSDEKRKEIELEFIQGKKLSENLDELNNKFEIMEKVGEETAKLHDANIIHGDLTTSNMILVENKIIDKNSKLINKKQIIKNELTIKTADKKTIIINNADDNEIDINNEKCNETLITDKFKVYIIDFGLGFYSERLEDKAVDLHLIKQALEAKHFKYHEKLFSSFLKAYKTSKNADKVLEQLKKVELRGRYKH